METLLTIAAAIIIAAYFGIRKYFIAAIVWQGTFAVQHFFKSKDMTAATVYAMTAVVSGLIALAFTLYRRKLMAMHTKLAEQLRKDELFFYPHAKKQIEDNLRGIEERIKSIG